MSEADEELFSRVSSHRFNDEEIPRSDLEKILEAGRMAPSAWNLQPWRFAVLKSEASIQKAVKCSYNQEFLGEADKIVMILGDERINTHGREALQDAVEKGYMSPSEKQQNMERFKEYADRSDEWKDQWLNRNCSFAASFMLIQADRLGISTCPVRGFDRDQAVQEFDLESWWNPILMIPMGYTSEQNTKKWRRSLESLVETF